MDRRSKHRASDRGPSLALTATDPVAAEVSPPHAFPGLVLAGKYFLVREIGRGGMGAVWLAERLGWNAPVAVKLMTLEDTAMARERFEREVQLAATLRSPHVVQVLDHGVDETTRAPFLVMELLEGESLADRRRRLGILSPSEIQTIVTQLGRALTKAHDNGIVHRDLKPDNIFLVPNGDEAIVKVLDFGVAKSLVVGPIDRRALTARGNLVGTPWYMSPEQIRGDPTDHRGDLWSLAVIACECITGRRPFQANDLPTLALLLWSEQRPVPSKLGVVPPGLDSWFAKATAHNVDERFQSAQELVDALRPICGSRRSERMPPLVFTRHPVPGHAPSVAPMTHTQGAGPLPFLSRRPKLLALLLTIVLVALPVSAYLLLRLGSSTRAAVSARDEPLPPESLTRRSPLTPSPLASPAALAPIAPTASSGQGMGEPAPSEPRVTAATPETNPQHPSSASAASRSEIASSSAPRRDAATGRKKPRKPRSAMAETRATPNEPDDDEIRTAF